MTKLNKLVNCAKAAILLFFLFSYSAFAGNIAITNWDENTHLNADGKSSSITVQGKVSGLSANEIITSFSIIFDPSRDMRIIQVICDSNFADYTFSGNALSVKFPKNKTNNSNFSLYFTYEEKYDKINKFLRQEAISIPSFAVGANAKVVINFPGYLESATLNPNVTKNGSSFIYQNIVPKDGVREVIKLTATQSVWDVALKIKVSAPQPLNKVIITMPTYFQNGGQKVENEIATSSITPLDQSITGELKTVKFDTSNKEILIKNKARISVGGVNRTLIKRNPNNYLSVTKDELTILTPILDQIRRDPKYQRLPLYAKIGAFVHDYIKYDLRYIGRLSGIREILQSRAGVCTEYARLFNTLARIALIPSLIVDGAACGEYQNCRGHAWNMIYYNGAWIDVDPTWDLMSGVVSSSHIYFNDYEKGGVGIQYFDGGVKVESNVDFDMTNQS